MTVSRIGNHSKGYLGGGSFGNGAENKAVGLGWLAVTGSEAGDVTIENLSSIIMSNLNQGVFFQSEKGASVAFTLCNPGLTSNPDPAVQSSAVWGNSTSLPAGTIVQAPVLFTACKITFTAPGNGVSRSAMMFYIDKEVRKPNVILANQAVKITDGDSDEGRHIAQKLDYETWLPFAAKVYKIDARIENFILVAVPICPATIPNRNGIGFPLNELTKFQPPPASRMSYKTWAGNPCHYEHDNEVHDKAYGVILDASLHKISGYGNGALWKVMGLAAIDKYKYPEMARRVAEGDINTYSMGAMVDEFSCSYCDAPMTDKHHCHHVNPKNDIDWQEFTDYDGSKHIAFRNAHGINGIELSLVESPAWATALSDHILMR